MKKCPVCQTVYADDSLSYCLTDGAALQHARDPDETLPAYDPNATLAYPPAHPTNPTIIAAPPSGRVVVPVITTPPPVTTAPPMVIKQGVSPIIVGVLAGLLILALGGLAAFVLKDNWATPAANPTPTPVAVVAPTPQTQPTTEREIVGVKQPTPYPTTQSQTPSATNANSAHDNDLAGRNCFQLKIRRNEIFARHGYIFKTPDMIDYFSRQPWYRATTSDVSGLLSPAEKSAVVRIQRYENSLGCR